MDVDFCVDAYDRALTAKCDWATTCELVTTMRRGDRQAMASLLKAFEWLVYDVAFDYAHVTRREAKEVVGPLFEGLRDAVEWLANSPRTDFEQFVREELDRKLRDFRRDRSPHLLVPWSTSSTRRRRGQQPYRHVWRTDDAGEDSDYATGRTNYAGSLTEHPEDKGPSTTQKDKRRRVPSRLYNQNDAVEMIDTLDAYTRTDEERRVADMLIHGIPETRIAAALSSTLYRVRAVMTTIGERMKRAGVAPDSVAAALKEPVPVHATVTRMEALERVRSSEPEFALPV